MWWRCVLLICVLGLVMDCTEAYSEDSPTKYNDDNQLISLEEVLIIELFPKYMKVLDSNYDDFLMDSAHILPMTKSHSYPQKEFVLEGRVHTKDSLELVQITFTVDHHDGYRVSRFSHKPLN